MEQVDITLIERFNRMESASQLTYRMTYSLDEFQMIFYQVRLETSETQTIYTELGHGPDSIDTKVEKQSCNIMYIYLYV